MSTPVYLDFGFLQVGNYTWAKNTVFARTMDTAADHWASNASSAYAAADPGGVIFVYGSQGNVPDITKSITYSGVNGLHPTSGFTWMDLTRSDGGPDGVVVSGDGVLARFYNVRFSGGSARSMVRATAGAKVALVGCSAGSAPDGCAIGYADDGGALVCVGCDGAAPVGGPQGAVGSFPKAKMPAGRAAPARGPGQYRTRLTLLAPAGYPLETGDERRVWVEAIDFSGRYDPVRSSEGRVARVEIAGSTGMVYTRVGLPATHNMRVRWRGTDLEITGVEVVDQIRGELMLGVADLQPGA